MAVTRESYSEDFAADVLRGLSASPKFLSSRYFYDDAGSKIFQRIMELPEYYLTKCETEIFNLHSTKILRAFSEEPATFDLIELGAGDGIKTAILVERFLKEQEDFRFVPIDISSEAMNTLTERFAAQFPKLDIDSRVGDYFSVLGSLKRDLGRRKLILFLGSNIGNFSEIEANAFFVHLRELMQPADRILIGFDLHKDPHTIISAYDDPGGVTAEFNLNLLQRINRELGADFDCRAFSHYASYFPIERAAHSFLVSRKHQTVSVAALDQKFEFEAWEPVFMEVSQKYDLRMIEHLASESGFRVDANFFDPDRYFVDSMWRPV